MGEFGEGSSGRRRFAKDYLNASEEGQTASDRGLHFVKTLLSVAREREDEDSPRKVYPSIAQVFIFLQALDIASHWCHMYASLVSGGTSHKVLSNHHNWLVRSYYANRIFMGTCCVP